jgi:GMP reductase
MDTTGTPEIARVFSQHELVTAIAKHYEAEDFAALPPEVAKQCAISSGTSDYDFERMKRSVEANPEVPFLCLDVANGKSERLGIRRKGECCTVERCFSKDSPCSLVPRSPGYSEHFVDYIRKVRELYPDKTIMAGNVVTGEMTEELLLSGADIVKVGIGPGSVCTTRMKTGVGYPQLSAVIECADAAHGLRGHIISDGGCTVPGDVAKAFGAGADFVMLGGMLAGHDESGGEVVEKEGKLYKLFYGMSSETAMKKYAGEWTLSFSSLSAFC